MNILDLPSELIETILFHLYSGDIASFTQVNKKTFAIFSNNEHFWKTFQSLHNIPIESLPPLPVSHHYPLSLRLQILKYDSRFNFARKLTAPFYDFKENYIKNRTISNYHVKHFANEGTHDFMFKMAAFGKKQCGKTGFVNVLTHRPFDTNSYMDFVRKFKCHFLL